METREQLQSELNAIRDWEKDQKDLFIWEKIGRIPFMVLDKITPNFLHKKMESILDEIAKYVDNGGQYLSNSEKVLKEVGKKLGKAEVDTLEEISELSINEMDALAEHFIANRKTGATIQGATTGFGGIFTLAIDIPFILGLTLKTMQEVAISYGYDPTDKNERIFMIKIMQFSSSDIVGKRTILEDLSENKKGASLSQLQGWREVFMTYRDNFGWKKLFQMIPIAGMIFGAFINKSAIEDVGIAAKMMYKKRRILEKLNIE